VSPASPILTLDRVAKVYETPAGRFTALDEVSLRVGAGELVAVVGRSGSGKTTLLNLVAGIDPPTRGEITVAGEAVHGRTEDELAALRGRLVGVVFQFFQLLPTLTVLENVVLPMDLLGAWPRAQQRARAGALLEELAIARHAGKLPAALSGGEQQRAAIARALANDPPILLADEPTGNLDSRTSAGVLDAFADLARAGKTVVMVTHDRGAAARATRTIALEDGRVAEDRRALPEAAHA
jgi:putative ABC transport system ATP-binding protein